MTEEEIKTLQRNDLCAGDIVKVSTPVYLNGHGFFSGKSIGCLCGAIGEVVCHNSNGTITVNYAVKDVSNMIVPQSGFLTVDLPHGLVERVEKHEKRRT